MAPPLDVDDRLWFQRAVFYELNVRGFMDLNADGNGPHTPGLSVECARWVAEESAVIGLGVEIFYLRDVFNDRQNTLFKFYYQMWVLWSIASVASGC